MKSLLILFAGASSVLLLSVTAIFITARQMELRECQRLHNERCEKIEEAVEEHIRLNL